MEKIEQSEFIDCLNNFAKISSEISGSFGSFIFLPKKIIENKKNEEKISSNA